MMTKCIYVLNNSSSTMPCMFTEEMKDQVAFLSFRDKLEKYVLATDFEAEKQQFNADMKQIKELQNRNDSLQSANHQLQADCAVYRQKSETLTEQNKELLKLLQTYQKEIAILENLKKQFDSVQKNFEIGDIVKIRYSGSIGIVREKYEHNNWIVETLNEKSYPCEIHMELIINEKERGEWLQKFRQKEFASVSSQLRQMPKDQQYLLLQNFLNEQTQK